jgi:hypothetical protein
MESVSSRKPGSAEKMRANQKQRSLVSYQSYGRQKFLQARSCVGLKYSFPGDIGAILESLDLVSNSCFPWALVPGPIRTVLVGSLRKEILKSNLHRVINIDRRFCQALSPMFAKILW